MDTVNEKLDQIDKEIGEMPFMADFQEKTGVKPLYVFGGLVGVSLLFVLTGYFAPFLANLVGFVYPAWKTFKSLETKGFEDDRQWLTYWTVYGLFIVFDDWSGIFLHYIPHYYTFKLIFLVWLFSPSTNGAIVLYNLFIKGLFSKYSKQIDDLIARIVGESQDFVDKAKKDLSDPNNQAKIFQAASKVATATSETTKPAE